MVHRLVISGSICIEPKFSDSVGTHMLGKSVPNTGVNA